jgi:hypothetical protein
LLPLRRGALEAGRLQVGVPTQPECHRQRNVMPAAAERVAVDGKGKVAVVISPSI